MKSRMAQLIIDATGPDGKIDLQKLYQAIKVTPESQEALFADACIHASEMVQKMEQVEMRVRSLVNQVELAVKQTKDLPGRVSERLDAKPLADALANTLKLELSRSGFRETSAEVKRGIEESITRFGAVKGEMENIQKAVKESIQKADQAGERILAMSNRLSEKAGGIEKVSRWSLYGTAVVIGVLVAALLSWESWSFFDRRLKDKFDEIERTEKVVADVTQLGKRVWISKTPEDGQYFLGISGASKAVYDGARGYGFVYLK